MEAIPIVFSERVAPEDQARADFYALLSRLYAAAPDATLLATIGAAQPLKVAEGDAAAAALARSWQALVAASAGADADAIASEYQTLFVGVGASEVSLHGSAYAKSRRGGPLLVQLRDSLAQLHLTRAPGVTLFEDHLAAVFETMRLLVGGDGQPGEFAFDVQREFFSANIEPWVCLCCNAICAKPVAIYYVQVAQFTRDFLVIERDSFTIES